MARKTAATKPKTDTGDYSSPAVDKAVDVIEFLASRRESASITSISEGIGRSVGEIYRVVRALERRQIVFKNPTTDCFQISLRLLDLAFRFPPVERLISLAQPEMDDLSEKTLQSCHLAVTEGSRLTIIASKESPLPMHYSVRIGSSFDIAETSSGVVLSAFASKKQQSALLDPLSKAGAKRLEDRFTKIRTLGYEIRESDVVDGLFNISVGIRSKEGLALGALTVPYLRQKEATVSQQEVLELQIIACRKIGEGLG